MSSNTVALQSVSNESKIPQKNQFLAPAIRGDSRASPSDPPLPFDYKDEDEDELGDYKFVRTLRNVCNHPPKETEAKRVAVVNAMVQELNRPPIEDWNRDVVKVLIQFFDVKFPNSFRDLLNTIDAKAKEIEKFNNCPQTDEFSKIEPDWTGNIKLQQLLKEKFQKVWEIPLNHFKYTCVAWRNIHGQTSYDMMNKYLNETPQRLQKLKQKNGVEIRRRKDILESLYHQQFLPRPGLPLDESYEIDLPTALGLDVSSVENDVATPTAGARSSITGSNPNGLELNLPDNDNAHDNNGEEGDSPNAPSTHHMSSPGFEESADLASGESLKVIHPKYSQLGGYNWQVVKVPEIVSKLQTVEHREDDIPIDDKTYAADDIWPCQKTKDMDKKGRIYYAPHRNTKGERMQDQFLAVPWGDKLTVFETHSKYFCHLCLYECASDYEAKTHATQKNHKKRHWYFTTGGGRPNCEPAKE